MRRAVGISSAASKIKRILIKRIHCATLSLFLRDNIYGVAIRDTRRGIRAVAPATAFARISEGSSPHADRHRLLKLTRVDTA